MTPPKAELRLDNWIFKCGLEDKFYNARDVTAYFVMIMSGLAPTQAGQVVVTPAPFLICEKCYKDNIDKGLNFKDPSGIVMPNQQAIIQVSKKKN